jgi:hypothetical protein
MKLIFKEQTQSDFVHKYLLSLKFIHGITGNALKILELMITDYLLYEESIKKDSKIFVKIFNKKSKDNYKKILNLKPQVFNNAIAKLRKAGALNGNTINSYLIPKIKNGETSLIINFKLDQ